MSPIGDQGSAKKVVWWVVRQCAKKAAIDKVAPHDLRRTCARLCHATGGELSRSSSCWGIARWRPRNGILAPGRGSCTLSTISWASGRMPVRGEEVTENATLQAYRKAVHLSMRALTI